jgi:hypothetical protein
MAQRSDNGRFLQISVNWLETGERMEAITVHGTTAANAFSAGSSERQGGVLGIFDFQKGVEVHRGAIFEVEVVGHVLGLVLGVGRVGTVDQKSLAFVFDAVGHGRVKFFDVVDILNALKIFIGTLMVEETDSRKILVASGASEAKPRLVKKLVCWVISFLSMKKLFF